MTLNVFEQIKRVNEYGSEYWSARGLSKVLDYTDYSNFLKVVDKAKESCGNSKQDIHNHFGEANDMVSN